MLIGSPRCGFSNQFSFVALAKAKAYKQVAALRLSTQSNFVEMTYI
jgi:hypothetical protein